MQPTLLRDLLRLEKGQIRVAAAAIAGTHAGATGWGSCRLGAYMAITVRGNADPVEGISAGPAMICS
jgi:hypothetical protein